MHETKVNIRIARSSGGPDGPQIHLEIQDRIFRMQLLDMYIPLATFGSLITGMSESDLPATVADAEVYAKRMGKSHEVSEKMVYVEDLLQCRDLVELRKRAQALEADGWVSETLPSWNGRRVFGGNYRVSYSRWV